jgi:hypothetical protein
VGRKVLIEVPNESYMHTHVNFIANDEVVPDVPRQSKYGPNDESLGNA